MLEWTIYIFHFLVFISTLIIIGLVVCYYRRKELFLIGIPLIFFSISITGFSYWYLEFNSSDECSADDCPKWMGISSNVSHFLFNMGHLFFAT